MVRCDANGNTFLIFESSSPEAWFSSNKCNEDGAIWLFKTGDSWRMEYFNCDGSKATMCGNGARSVFYYLHKFRSLSKNIWHTIQTSSGELKGRIDSDGMPIVSMPKPILLSEVTLKNSIIHHVQVGVHHAARQVKNIELLESFELKDFFTEVRNHPLIPSESNVNVFFCETNHIWLRTFENGVNRETKSCGTGCTAIAFLLKNQLDSPYNEWIVTTNGGDIYVLIDEDFYYLKGRVSCNDII
ncbi:MAG: hypothetical protein KAH01_04215 [Caldisericia bacterium]|nr:hypothetical protein [Caldisericia bacterium]